MDRRCLRFGRPAILPWIALLVMGVLLVAGCGKKGPPRLPDASAPADVKDLAAVLEGDEIVLRWTAPEAREGAGAPAGYQVYRSAEPVGGEPCEGCPILFRRVARVPLAGDVSGSQALVYREPRLSGTRYSFKVVQYDAQGQLGPDSNIARIVTE